MNDTNKLIIFDLNKTLIRQSSWYELNTALGMTPQEDELLFRLGPEKEGIINHHEWINLISRILVARGKATRKAIEDILLNYSFMDSAQETIKQLQDMGYTVAIISGGFNIVVDQVAATLGIRHAYSNTYIVYDGNDMLKNIVLTFPDNEYKVELVNSVCNRFGLHPKDVYYVADGDNDKDIFLETKGVSIVNEVNTHEPWKQKAIDNGEKFARHTAHENSTHKIGYLSEIIQIVKDDQF